MINTLLVQILEHPGRAFPAVVPIVLVGAVVAIALHALLTLAARPAARAARPRWSLWERLVYAASLLSIASLGTTAFYAVLRLGAMEGWLLLAHMCAAGVFVAVLPLLAITWCEANRFLDEGRGAEAEPAPRRFFWLPKVMFWVILVSGLAVASTMLVSMLPLFGTEGLHRLLDIHRYSGLLVVVAAVFHFYGVWLGRLGWR
jgi:hypothetical protein